MNEARKETAITYATDHGEVKLSPAIVKRYLVSGKPELVSETEIIMFMQLCRYQGLNPFLREAYLIKYSNDSPATMVTGKDTFTKRAASIKECQGYNAGIIVASERRKGAALFEGEKLLGGWAEVFRDGWKEPLHVEVALSEYLRKNREGKPTKSWAEMPATMIRKVALVQALREAFPDRFQGLYDAAEMPVQDAKLPEEPVKMAPEGEQGAKEAFDKAIMEANTTEGLAVELKEGTA
jgi:phage recombination protein Bet